jgi:hypothetical protein
MVKTPKKLNPKLKKILEDLKKTMDDELWTINVREIFLDF